MGTIYTPRVSGTAAGGATKRVTGTISQNITIRTGVPDPLVTENNQLLHLEVGTDYLELE